MNLQVAKRVCVPTSVAFLLSHFGIKDSRAKVLLEINEKLTAKKFDVYTRDFKVLRDWKITLTVLA